MIRFLFWNVGGVASIAERSRGKARALMPGDARYKRLRRILSVAVARKEVDIVILAESPFEGQLGLSGFVEAKTSIKPNSQTGVKLEIYHQNTVSCTGFQVVDRAVLHDMKINASGLEFILVSAHLNSPLHMGEETRAEKVKELAADIIEKETRIGHHRVVLVGDLNYDPHDAPVISASGLNAVASKVVALQQMRQAGRYSYPYFYNPMWAHLSDVTGPQPGTYYRKTKEVDCRFWYMFDQVMIRPALLNYWDDSKLEILSNIGKISLLDKKDTPARKRFSDHLPVFFALDL